MAIYHLEIRIISRGKARSPTGLANYITGEKLYDVYEHTNCSSYHENVLCWQILLPDNAPQEFQDLQELFRAIDAAEKRYDARTGREFIGALPNELNMEEQINIVTDFARTNFVDRGLCAVFAIHLNENPEDPSRNNPHMHLFVNTRMVTVDGFSKKKDRRLDKLDQLRKWRKSWEDIQNAAFERNGLDIRVSHESFEVQGITDKEATIHLTRSDYEKEQRGIRTPAGDRKREIEERNRQREIEAELRREHRLERSLSR